MRLTIGKKLGLGFFAVLALMAVSAVIVYLSVANMNRNLQVVSHCEQILNGLNHSLASLRGYVLLGDDEGQAEDFQKERLLAWKNIESGQSALSDTAARFAASEDTPEWGVINENLASLRDIQDQVEQIAQTDDNRPAMKLFVQEAVPAAEKTLAAITRLTDAEAANQAADERKKLQTELADFRASFVLALADLRAYLFEGKPTFLDGFKKNWAENESAYAALEEQSELFMGDQVADWQALKQHRAALTPLPPKLLGMRSAADWNRANHLMETQSVPKATAIRDALEKLKANALSELNAAQNAVTATLLVSTLLAVVIGSLIAFVLSRRMTRALQNVLSRVQDVAAGDLTGDAVRLSADDEIGDLSRGFDQMVAALRGILAESSTTTREVATASSQIASGAQQQLTSLNQTATSLNEITTASEEFKATMQEFADRARAVQEAADETTERTSQGRLLTQESSARITQVQANSQTAGQSVLKLSEQMQRIGEITATVNEIAEQTKLLALNASIEAARAGEEGRGFAVVATQVRELANQSKDSSRRIELLIADTQKSMQEVVAKIEEGSRLSEVSVAAVQQMAQAFEEIAQAIEQTRDALSQINMGAKQQEQGIVELVASISEIDSGSRESVAAAEQTQNAIVAIDQRIQALNGSIARFKT